MMRSSVLICVLVCAAMSTSGARAQGYDGNAPTSSSSTESQPAQAPGAASLGNPGSSDAAPSDALATIKAAPESPADVWRLWGLKPLSAPLGIESILEPDDRQKVPNTTTYPERAVVLITSAGGRCSGAMISPNTVLTAGHCVHSGGTGGAWATNVVVFPGRNGPQSPYGSCGSTTLYSVLGWTRDRNEQYDYGVIKLNCAIGNTVGWFGFYWQSASLVGTPVTILGYPGDKPLEQWRATDSIRDNDALQVFYRNDTVPGSSGSGVFTTASAHCSGPCILAVHAYGVHGSGAHGSNNHGIRITQAVFNNLMTWRNAP